MIFASRPELYASAFGADSGIALEQACGARVYHNTIYFTNEPFVAFEYRWANTSAEIVNNLVSHNIVSRDGGQASLIGNMAGQGGEHFVDATLGQLHLVAGSPAIDGGDPLTLDWVDTDFDGELRDAAPDVGADELLP